MLSIIKMTIIDGMSFRRHFKNKNDSMILAIILILIASFALIISCIFNEHFINNSNQIVLDPIKPSNYDLLIFAGSSNDETKNYDANLKSFKKYKQYHDAYYISLISIFVLFVINCVFNFIDILTIRNSKKIPIIPKIIQNPVAKYLWIIIVFLFCHIIPLILGITLINQDNIKNPVDEILFTFFVIFMGFNIIYNIACLFWYRYSEID